MKIEYINKCAICGFNVRNSLGVHIHFKHPEITAEEYYNTYVNPGNNEGKCEQCGKPTKYRDLKRGYFKYCCEECRIKHWTEYNKELHKNHKSKKQLEREDVEKNGKYVCKICGKRTNRLGMHLRNQHNIFENNHKEYYDKFLKKPNEGYCAVCGKETAYQSVLIGYKKFCCASCAMKSEETLKKMRDTFMKNQNIEGEYTIEEYKEARQKHILEKDPDFYKKMGKKVHESFKRNTGLNSTFQLEKTKESAKKTNLERHGVEHWTNREKCKQTMLNKTGYEYAFQVPEIKEKMEEKSLKEHGQKLWTNREKCKQTMLENTGHEYLFQTQNFNDKVKEKCLKNHGVEYNCQRPEVIEKIKQSCIDSFGYSNPMKCPEIRNKTKKKFKYKNLNFDSGFELVYYIWLKDHNIEFEYQPNTTFKYEYQGKTYDYCPDFLINGEYIELKGLQFFKNKDNNDVMICPYKHKNDTEETIEWRNGLYEAKHQCMLKNGVKIITDLPECYDYINKKYGRNYINQFKNG